MEGKFQVEYIFGPLDGTLAVFTQLLDQVWVQSPNEEHVKQDIFPVYELHDKDSNPVKYRFIGWSQGIGNEARTGK